MAAEWTWLVLRRDWTIVDAGLLLLPGALMMIALRAALAGAAWPMIALPLSLSFPAHIADVRRRELRR